MVKWTRLGSHDFVDNRSSFLCRLALPISVRRWSLTTLRERFIKIGETVVPHARCVIFQMAEVAIPRRLFAVIGGCIRRLRPKETVLR